MTQKIADRLKELRGKASQADIAKIVGRSAATVSNWENWENPDTHTTPDAESVARLAKHWGVSADYIVGLSDFKTGLAPDSWIVDADVADALLAGTPRKQVADRFGDGLGAKVPRRPVVLAFLEYEDLKRRIAKALGEKGS